MSIKDVAFMVTEAMEFKGEIKVRFSVSAVVHNQTNIFHILYHINIPQCLVFI